MATVLNALNNPISSVHTQERKELDIKPGDTVRVYQKIQEKDKVRLQVFEGVVLARKHGSEAGATFTVRRVVDGVGVEKIFPLYSPMIDKIEIVRRAKVRRAKLYYIRDKAVREIKRQMRRMTQVDISTESDIGRAARIAQEEADAEARRQEEEARKLEEMQGTEETPVEEKQEDVSVEGMQSSENTQAEKEE